MKTIVKNIFNDKVLTVELPTSLTNAKKVIAKGLFSGRAFVPNKTKSKTTSLAKAPFFDVSIQLREAKNLGSSIYVNFMTDKEDYEIEEALQGVVLNGLTYNHAKVTGYKPISV